MRENRTSGSMRGCRRRAKSRRACALLYRAPNLASFPIRVSPFRRSRPLPRKLFRRSIRQATVRPALVVVDPPVLDLATRVRHTRKPIRVETFVPKSSIETLDETVLYQLAWLDMNQSDTALFGPCNETPAGKFRPVIDTNALGLSPLGDHLVQRACYPRRRQRTVYLDHRRFLGKAIYNRQRPQRAARGQRVGD